MRVAYASNFVLPDLSKTNKLIKKFLAAGEIEHIPGLSGIFRITVPYASVLACPDEVILQETNPLAVFSSFTAAQYHNLTYEVPNEIHLTQYKNTSTRLPLGTTPEDWIDVPEPKLRSPKLLHGTTIFWHKAKEEWDFGHTLGHVQGHPIYITDIERTLIDCLRFPERCGGITETLNIWKRAENILKIDVLISYVEKFRQTLLRQRVGYLLEQLGETHSKFNEWAENSVRGSSAKLFANADFSPTYSARWNLSINAPGAILSELSEN
tara:strand:+ start:11133 stop:11933 length:801 start_codon:yes stop_codon:yes gene_type:complete